MINTGVEARHRQHPAAHRFRCACLHVHCADCRRCLHCNSLRRAHHLLLPGMQRQSKGRRHHRQAAVLEVRNTTLQKYNVTFKKARVAHFQETLDRASCEKPSTGRFFYFPDLRLGKKYSAICKWRLWALLRDPINFLPPTHFFLAFSP